MAGGTLHIAVEKRKGRNKRNGVVAVTIRTTAAAYLVLMLPRDADGMIVRQDGLDQGITTDVRGTAVSTETVQRDNTVMT